MSSVSSRAARGRGAAGWSSWWWLVIAIGLSGLLHLPFLRVPLISDEGGYAYVAHRWLDHGATLYQNVWVSRPQGIFVAYGLILHTLGSSVTAIRLGAWLVSIATLIAVWWFARRWAGNQAATAAALLFAVLSGSPMIEGFTANAEVFMALPAVLMAIVLLRTEARGWSGPALGVAGILAGVATQLKPSGIVMLGVGLAFTWLVGPECWRRRSRLCGWLGAGFVISLGPAVVQGWLVGWHDFFFAAVSYRITHQSSATTSATRHLQAIWTLTERIAPVLLLLAVVLFLRAWTGQREQHATQPLGSRFTDGFHPGIVASLRLRALVAGADPGDVLLRLWLLAALAGIAMGGDWWAHYLIQIASPFAIWLAVLLVNLWPELRLSWRRLLVAIVLVTLVLPYWVIGRGDPNAISQRLYPSSGYTSQAPVAAYLRSHTPTGAPIYVAFDQAAVYYITDRPAAYRYMYDQELQAIPSAENDLVAMMTGPNRPYYIVATGEAAPFPNNGKAFWTAVAQHYHLERAIAGVAIFRANT